MKNLTKKIFPIIALALTPFISVFSQPAPPSNTTVFNTELPMNCTNAPIGNGVIIMVVLALCYATYLYRNLKIKDIS